MTWNYYHNTNNKSSPAPFLDVTINFRGSRKSITVPMLIDTGSFQTILPLHILKDDLFATQLKGKPFEVKGYDGITKKHPIFIVDLIIQENTIP